MASAATGSEAEIEKISNNLVDGGSGHAWLPRN